MNIIARVRPVFRQLAGLHTSRSVRLRYRRTLLRRRVDARASSILCAYRGPITVIAVSAGAYLFVSYKIREFWKTVSRWVSSVQTAVTKSAFDAVKFVSANVPEVKLPEKSIKDLHKTVTGALSSAQKAAGGVVKSVSASTPSVGLPDIGVPQFLKNLFKPGSKS